MYFMKHKQKYVLYEVQTKKNIEINSYLAEQLRNWRLFCVIEQLRNKHTNQKPYEAV